MSERQLIAGELAHYLTTAENSIDQGCIDSARLNGALVQARLDAGLSAVVAEDVFSDCAAAHAALFEARQRVTRAHRNLDRLRKVLRLQPVAFSGSGDKPVGDSPPSHFAREVIPVIAGALAD